MRAPQPGPPPPPGPRCRRRPLCALALCICAWVVGGSSVLNRLNWAHRCSCPKKLRPFEPLAITTRSKPSAIASAPCLHACPVRTKPAPPRFLQATQSADLAPPLPLSIQTGPAAYTPLPCVPAHRSQRASYRSYFLPISSRARPSSRPMAAGSDFAAGRGHRSQSK